MIKEITEYNKKITNEILLKENAESLINSLLDSNGNLNIAYIIGQIPEKFYKAFEESFDEKKFSEIIKEYKKEDNDSNVDNNTFVKNIINESYGLNFLGKSLGKVLARQKSTTVFVPDEKNNEEINKNSKNIYITADNLEALRHLKNSYSGRIKCIYIDPPYNTGSDGFCYPDDFYDDVETIKTKFGVDDNTANAMLGMTSNKSNSHNAWLSFMYPRLLLAKELLCDEGCILVSIDENEFRNVGLLLDLVFDENNFVECLVYDKKAAPKGVPPKEMVVGVHEYIFVYAKEKDRFAFKGKIRNIKDFPNDDNDGRGPWRNTNIKSTTGTDSYTIVDPATGNEYTDTWAFEKEELNRLINENRIIFPREKTGQVRAKEYFNDFESPYIPIKSNLGLYDAQVNTLMLKKLMGKDKLFPNPKNINLMRDLMSFILNDGDICLDFFGGSSSTAHGVIKNAIENNVVSEYIIVQKDELFKESSNAFKAGYKTIDELGIERISRVINYYKNEGIDIHGFKHYTLVDKGNTLDKLEKFDENSLSINYDIMDEFDSKSLLITFAVDDGFGLNPYIEEIDLDGYIAYRVENKEWTEEVVLYLLDKGFEDKHYQNLIKISNERCLNISKVIVFGYAFGMRELQLLNANISQLGIKFNNDNNVKLKPIVRY